MCNNMKTLLAIIAFLSSSFYLCAQKCDSIKVKKYLNQLFNEKHFLSYDSTQFGSYSGQVMLLNTAVMDKYLPDYCFYSTIFYSHYFEYRNVETILAFKSDSLNPSIIHSPIFTKEPSTFFELFCGIKIIDSTDKLLFAKEVVTMISKITYKGEAKRVLMHNNSNCISFELWHMDLSRRIYDFNFNAENILMSISIQSGTGRGKVKEGYFRL